MTDHYAVIMHHVCTGDHAIYDVGEGENGLLAALDQALHETTPCTRPIVLRVEELLAELYMTPEELAEIMQDQD